MKEPNYVCKEIAQIQSLYLDKTPANYKDESLIPIRDLIADLQEYYEDDGLEIVLKDFQWTDQHNRIYGIYERNASTVTIHYARNENNVPNNCAKRFIIAKELSHYIVDSTESYTSSPGSLLSVICKYSNSWAPENTSLDRQKNVDEMGKIYGALLLFPFEKIKEKRVLLADPDNDVTHMDIAEEFKIPEVIVDYMLDDAIYFYLEQWHLEQPL